LSVHDVDVVVVGGGAASVVVVGGTTLGGILGDIFKWREENWAMKYLSSWRIRNPPPSHHHNHQRQPPPSTIDTNTTPATSARCPSSFLPSS